MADFMTKLWESVFTPGPTPTILVAANVSFAALQVTLFALLLATYSVHCAVLSILCAGLWWSINWFAAELAAVQRQQKEEEEKKAAESPTEDADDAKDSSADDTEVDESSAAGTTSFAPLLDREQLKKRAATKLAAPERTPSSASTEDEWEKVSENGKEKEK
ncbi:ER protein Pkr1 [Geosmithia morbida]|uniref:ER protein Pkr1 n=1 Tax=Geosmithia morbida TaxID=1094350 RepID=A0A9P4YWM9_9HYPO|nr:ER protein Pkr1 [Geosmithia morbida]KAF4122399.1 ER protein Pkr1 [Geosmithia morbida]